MSLLPYFDDICNDLELWNSKFLNDSFFWDDHYHHYHHHHHYHHNFPGWHHHSLCCRNILKTKISINDKGLKIKMNLPHFKANDITVKTLDDVIVIEGKQKLKNSNTGDNGDDDNSDSNDDADNYDRYCYLRHFIRKYKLPKGYNPDTVTSTFSSDSILIVTAPAPIHIPDVKERIIDVKQTEPEC